MLIEDIVARHWCNFFVVVIYIHPLCTFSIKLQACIQYMYFKSVGVSMFGCCIYLYIALYLHCPVYSAPYIFFLFMYCLAWCTYFSILLFLICCPVWAGFVLYIYSNCICCPVWAVFVLYIFQLHMLSCMCWICPLYIFQLHMLSCKTSIM